MPYSLVLNLTSRSPIYPNFLTGRHLHALFLTHQVIGYDVINMPPVSLIRNVRMRGEYYQISDRTDLKIPARLSYRFG
jgi:CRISPR-associated protein Csc1